MDYYVTAQYKYHSCFHCHVYRTLLKAAVIILPILGCTWVFGLLAINEDTIAFAWIFTILNSLQVSYHMQVISKCIVLLLMFF